MFVIIKTRFATQIPPGKVFLGHCLDDVDIVRRQTDVVPPAFAFTYQIYVCFPETMMLKWMSGFTLRDNVSKHIHEKVGVAIMVDKIRESP
ncbi:hypothetical protein IEQ34_002491 [Dendrobium chrysotoxum]|uniref:Uncharacterized protein n=1 Tax=Dendrobium chrysotoxum TaxID=161865 RepID=A0AAV7H638_DENCH|nr:hypothetical protein IEQ34_002491 [Dendrobium chrysotoxum]